MADIKLDPAQVPLFTEVGSRGDYFREAIRDRAAEQVNQTGKSSEITSGAKEMLDVVLAPVTSTIGESVTQVVPPSDFSSVVGEDPGADPDPKRTWPAKDVSRV
jgi:hypothetical protein